MHFPVEASSVGSCRELPNDGIATIQSGMQVLGYVRETCATAQIRADHPLGTVLCIQDHLSCYVTNPERWCPGSFRWNTELKGSLHHFLALIR